MAVRLHAYQVALAWSGNRGAGTSAYSAYSRDYQIRAAGPAPIAGSSDPHFRGDTARWNPEQLLVAALAACHQLWYLHLCAEAGIVVTAYEDAAIGMMEEMDGGAGQFTHVTLHPHVTLEAGSDAAAAMALHHAASEHCFIARSVAFPVLHEPRISSGSAKR